MERCEQGSASRGGRERTVRVSAHAIDHHQKHSTRGSGYRHPVLVFLAMAYVAELRELHWRTVLDVMTMTRKGHEPAVKPGVSATLPV
jgi:hypothetical protein